MCNCSFFVGNKMIDNVDRFSQLGHTITSSLLDGDDIVQQCNTFVGQTNNVLCNFNKLYYGEALAYMGRTLGLWQCQYWDLLFCVEYSAQAYITITIKFPFLLSSYSEWHFTHQWRNLQVLDEVYCYLLLVSWFNQLLTILLCLEDIDRLYAAMLFVIGITHSCQN